MNQQQRETTSGVFQDDSFGRGVLAYLKEAHDTRILGRVYDKIRAGLVEEGMHELLPALQGRRLKASDADWEKQVEGCLAHPLRELLHQDPFTHRAFAKPRGYAGDAALLDFIYGREEGWPAPPGTTELGQKIFEFTTRSSACEAVCARRGFVADLLDRLADELPRPHVLSIAAGHLREVLLSAAVKRRKLGRFVALDADARSLEEVQRCYGLYGIETVAGTLRQLLTQKADLGAFDLVYSTGLLDYVPLAAARRLTSSMFQMLRPRGRLLLANFMPGILDVGYMESYMGWKLVYRTRRDMLDLSEEIPEAHIRDIRLFAEDNQNIIFLQVTRR
jgi:SAM-dependent methyltransferase